MSRPVDCRPANTHKYTAVVLTFHMNGIKTTSEHFDCMKSFGASQPHMWLFSLEHGNEFNSFARHVTWQAPEFSVWAV